MTEYPFVYRFRTPVGLRGQRCRRLDFSSARRRFADGSIQLNAGDELVAVEFTSGRRETVSRAGIVPADSKSGRMTMARLARGDVSPSIARRRAGNTTHDNARRE